MKKRLLCLLALPCLALRLAGQPLPFVKTFGDSTFNEYGIALAQMNDGRIFVAGHAQADSIGGWDIALARLDASGNLQWVRYFGTATDDYAEAMTLTPDSFLVIAGSTGANNNRDAFVIKLDMAGSEVWQRTYPTPSLTQSFLAIDTTAGGGFIVSGFETDTVNTGNNSIVARLDNLGNLQWLKSYGPPLNDYAQGVRQTAGGNYIAVSDRQKPDFNYDIYLRMLDANGDSLWQLEVNTPYNAGSQCIIITQDGDFLVAGESSTPTSIAFDVYLAKVSAAGGLLWKKYVYGTSQAEAGFWVHERMDGSLAITGYGYNEEQQENDLLYITTDSAGNLTGKKTIGNIGTVDIGYHIIPGIISGYLMTGQTSVAGDVQYLLVYDTLPPAAAAGVSLLQAREPGLLLYPNPATGVVNVEGDMPLLWRLYDSRGAFLLQSGGRQMDVSAFPEGLYFVLISTESGTTVRKLVVCAR